MFPAFFISPFGVIHVVVCVVVSVFYFTSVTIPLIYPPVVVISVSIPFGVYIASFSPATIPVFVPFSTSRPVIGTFDCAWFGVEHNAIADAV